MRLPKHRPPVHPGEVLLKEFLKPLGMSQKELAERLGVSYPRINQLVRGKRSVTPDTALRLARLFGTTPEFWLELQLAYDLYRAKERGELERIRPLDAALSDA